MSRLGVFVAVVGSLLGVCPLLYSAYNLPKMLALYIGAALILWGVPDEEVEIPALTIPILAIFAVLCLTARLATDPLVSFMGYYFAPFHGVLAGLALVLLYIGMGVTRQGAALVRALAWSVITLTVWAFVQLARGVDLPLGRATSLVGSPVYLGACYAIALPVMMAMTVEASRPKVRTLGLVASIAVVVGIAAARAKGAAVAAAAGVVVYGILSRELSPRWLLAGLPLGGAVFALASRDAARLELYKVSARAFLSHPWLGWGPDNFLLAWRQHRTLGWIRIYGNTEMGQASAHNDLIQVAVTMGLLGLAAYVYLLWRTGREVYERSWDSKSAVIGGALTAAFVQAKFNPLPLPALALVAMIAAVLPGTRLIHGLWIKWVGVAIAGFMTIVVGQYALADYHYRIAFEATKPQMTVDHLQKAVQINPDEPYYMNKGVEVLLRIGQMYRQPEANDRALELAYYLTRTHASDPASWDALGSVLWAKKQYGQAYVAYTVASKLDPTFLLYLKARAIVATLAKKPEAKSIRRRYGIVRKAMGTL